MADETQQPSELVALVFGDIYTAGEGLCIVYDAAGGA
jgi:hypothetical protein